MKATISVAIVDDEPAARQSVRFFLEQRQDFLIVDEYEDGESALKGLKRSCPDLLLLDIEMPELSGLELVKNLVAPIPRIVFITAYDRYAVRAFEENAIDYLLKPFSQDRFDQMLERVRTVQASAPEKVIDVLNSLEEINQKYLRKITCKHRGRLYFVDVADIIWIESSGAFCKLHSAKKIDLVNKSISNLENSLDPDKYLRIHKSHIVNLDKVQSIEPYFHGEYMVKMTDGTDLKLSRTYKDRLGRILHQYG